MNNFIVIEGNVINLDKVVKIGIEKHFVDWAEYFVLVFYSSAQDVMFTTDKMDRSTVTGLLSKILYTAVDRIKDYLVSAVVVENVTTKPKEESNPND